MATSFERKLASLAEAEFDQFHGFHETTPKMAARIKGYWTSLGLHFPGVGTPWSAVFVSSFVKRAGASASEFKFSPRHSEFVHRAIANMKSGTGVFHGHPVSAYAPHIGDIIQNNRNGNTFDFNFAAGNMAYESHSAIVVEEGTDGNGRYVRTVGGNEADTVGERVVRLTSSGLIKQPAADPSRFICVIETLK
ncbi:hypothetical protein ASC75_06630 [Aminobacter sp. DSM 101952]|uniref:DUF2272 domain-containing protein n=1 Tax=Aminobacter sp. DSM 101952 TaxID=2735891 RepID=UPI0006F5B456|nr:DUF2272 domain-containing protein [Aminobacter sp. DSM 101952]KQU69820.1 hypothetical protein ASC75_06630 [Aminobacter sp. DSM 101952]